MANRSCHTHHFAHHARCSHNAHRTKSHMCNADVSSSHEEVAYIARVKTAVGHGVRIDYALSRDGFERTSSEVSSVNRIGIVQVYAPSGGEGSIFMGHVLHDVLFTQYVIAQQSTRFALASHVCQPIQLLLFVTSTVFTTVLEKAPIGVNHQHTIVAHTFQIIHDATIQSRFPCPFALQTLLGGLLVKANAIFEEGECRGLIFFLGVPLH